jgi:protein involved in polysaccharide export with SLBB domain
MQLFNLPRNCLRLLAWAALAALPSAPILAQEQAAPMNIGDYRIAPRDQVQFLVFEEPDVVVLQRVSSAGEISVPMLGAVKVAGLTLRQAESMLEKRYRDGGYYLNPQVILSFQAYAPRSISVLGQVNNPSQIDFAIERDQLGIISAITRAGGFTRVARTDSVKVMRMVEGKETSFTINVAAYLDERSKEQEFKLMPDDIVFIPERVF